MLVYLPAYHGVLLRDRPNFFHSQLPGAGPRVFQGLSALTTLYLGSSSQDKMLHGTKARSNE